MDKVRRGYAVQFKKLTELVRSESAFGQALASRRCQWMLLSSDSRAVSNEAFSACEDCQSGHTLAFPSLWLRFNITVLLQVDIVTSAKVLFIWPCLVAFDRI